MRPAAAWRSDKFPAERVTDLAALQNGAKLFVNYCLNCHSASYMRYNRMRDIGLTDEQIKNNLMFAADKVGDTMKVTLDPEQAKDWFGAAPPDLTVIARSRAGDGGSGADYLYTYLRTFYRDDSTATGWNNLVFPNVGMPHVLWELQGQQRAVFADREGPARPEQDACTCSRASSRSTPGTLNARRVQRGGGRPGGLPAVDGRAGTRASACAWACGCCSSWPCSR